MVTRNCLVLGSACLVLVFLGLAPAAAQDEKEAAMEKIQALLDGAEWKAAVKALKSYRRKHAETDSEKEEVSGLLARAEGFCKYEKIEASYRKSEKARKASKDLTKLIGEYTTVPDLVEKANELLDTVRSTYVLVIEDFEDWEKEEGEGENAGEGSDDLSRRRALVKDPTLVKHGKVACRWKAGMGWGWWSVDSPQLDWSEYDLFCVWIYNERLEKRPGRIEIEAYSGGGHYFQYFLAIDWVGWREIRMPLTGRASKFSKYGNADWKMIERVDFDHFDDIATPVDIIIDDIHLEKAVK